MCDIKYSNRAGKEHWAEYITFLHEFPCMINDQTQNDELWGNLSKRLNRVTYCKKSVQNWKQCIRNWRRYAIRKHEDNINLNESEEALIKLIHRQDKKKIVINANNNKPIPKELPIEKKNGNKNKKHVQIQNNQDVVHSNNNVVIKTNSPEKTKQLNGFQPTPGAIRGKKGFLQPLKIYYQNVRGLRTKLEKFSSAVLLENYDVIILTETWLLPAIASHRVFDDRYLVFRTDRSVLTSEKSIGGGVLIAVLKTHGSIKRHLTSGAVEEVWISLVKYNLVIGAVYFPPRTPESKFKEFLASARVLNRNNTGVIVGDFNMRRITWFPIQRDNLYIPTDVTIEAFKILLEGLKLLGVGQRNSIVNATGVVLDLVYTNTKAITVKTTESPFVFPDYHHPPLKILLSLYNGKPTGG